MRIDGKEYPTVSEAARKFKVNVRTVKIWIDKGIIPEPPTVDYGVRKIRVFPDEYMRRALKALDDYRKRPKKP